jgi:hypothetical protein
MPSTILKKILPSLPKKKKHKIVFPQKTANTFDFGKEHIIKIETKEDFSKRHIEFTLENLINLMSSMLVITYSKNDLLEKDKQVKSLFLESKIIPIITIEKKQEAFINPEDIEWHTICWGSSGKGKSYFSKEIVLVQIKFELAYYLETLLNFISENETSDKDLIQMNFQQDWERFLDHAQRALAKL